MRKALAPSFLLMVSIAGSSPAATACRATPPALMPAGAWTWIGPCPNGVAQGRGVLRVVRPRTAPSLFFGEMRHGRPLIGVMVIDGRGWYPAWRFDARLAARFDPSGDRRRSIATFDIAAAGAREASRRYRAQGNAASARFYENKAHELEYALD